MVNKISVKVNSKIKMKGYLFLDFVLNKVEQTKQCLT